MIEDQDKREPLSTEPYKGVRDFYPADWARLTATFNTIRTALELWGYEEYNASPLERAELYESKTSEEIVNEQTYTFEDRGQRRVTLRPEMTPTFARMVAGKRRELPMPLRWYSIPNLFRYERPQRGRLREHYQLNVDIAGIADAKADGEIIVIATEILKALGAKTEDFIVRVSSRPLLAAACAATGYDNEEAIRTYSRLLDKKSKMTLAEFEAALGPGRADPLKEIENPTDEKVREEKDKLMSLLEAFRARGLTNIVFDPEIVRGFDYYTGIVFEVYDTNPANPRAMFGGGRYDGLVGMFGGDPIPCIGFGMGDVVLMDFLETHGILPEIQTGPQVYVGTPSESDFFAAQSFAAQLRANGIRTLVNSSSKGLGDQIRDASRRNIPYFIAFGEQEASFGTIRMKTLATGDEQEISVEDVAARMSGS